MLVVLLDFLVLHLGFSDFAAVGVRVLAAGYHEYAVLPGNADDAPGCGGARRVRAGHSAAHPPGTRSRFLPSGEASTPQDGMGRGGVRQMRGFRGAVVCAAASLSKVQGCRALWGLPFADPIPSRALSGPSVVCCGCSSIAVVAVYSLGRHRPAPEGHQPSPVDLRSLSVRPPALPPPVVMGNAPGMRVLRRLDTRGTDKPPLEAGTGEHYDSTPLLGSFGLCTHPLSASGFALGFVMGVGSFIFPDCW